MMKNALAIVFALVLAASVAQANGPAMHIFEEDGCGVGWLGCDPAAAIPGDEGLTCPADQLGIINPTGDQKTVIPNEPNGIRIFHCKATIHFGEVVTTGADGSSQAVAVQPGTMCAVFANACNGEGTVKLDAETTGGFPCISSDAGPTWDWQLVVTPSGRANLVCFWPDSSPGNGP